MPVRKVKNNNMEKKPGETDQIGVKEKILKAAGALFSEKGYHGASMKDIARSAGVNKALIFYYFNSKENLYQDILKEVFEKTQINIIRRIEKADTPKEKLRAALDAYIRSFSESRNTVRMILYSLLGLGPSLPRPIDELVKISRKPLEEIIREGMKQNIFREDDPDYIANAAIGMMQIFFREPCQTGTCYNNEAILDKTIQILENGILSRSNL